MCDGQRELREMDVVYIDVFSPTLASDHKAFYDINKHATLTNASTMMNNNSIQHLFRLVLHGSK